jgi:alkanesulfonate monooxygenase SsuD/methylene tetrahydromethanopterin reductase-like flavin-dependent oxidoreductase (luciferase family)
MLVLGVPYRNPALVAKMLATLDVISHGRIIAGLGAGWHEQEFAAYGWPFPDLAGRMDRLEEAVQVIDALLRERPASFQGQHFTLDRALNDPRPVRQPRPRILVAGNGERRTLRIVARYAELCNVYGTVEEVGRKFDVLRRHCEEVGRPYEAITRTINYWAIIARDEADRAAQAARYPVQLPPQTPPELIDSLRAYEAADAQYAIVKILGADDLGRVRLFAELVLPAFAADVPC